VDLVQEGKFLDQSLHKRVFKERFETPASEHPHLVVAWSFGQQFLGERQGFRVHSVLAERGAEPVEQVLV
jgi:hypothetical protein